MSQGREIAVDLWMMLSDSLDQVVADIVWIKVLSHFDSHGINFDFSLMEGFLHSLI